MNQLDLGLCCQVDHLRTRTLTGVSHRALNGPFAPVWPPEPGAMPRGSEDLNICSH